MPPSTRGSPTQSGHTRACNSKSSNGQVAVPLLHGAPSACNAAGCARHPLYRALCALGDGAVPVLDHLPCRRQSRHGHHHRRLQLRVSIRLWSVDMRCARQLAASDVRRVDKRSELVRELVVLRRPQRLQPPLHLVVLLPGPYPLLLIRDSTCHRERRSRRLAIRQLPRAHT